MSQAVFSLAYFGPIHYYRSLVKYNSIWLEASENYQKQSYRNRQYIYGANGKLMLNIPVKHSRSQKRLKYQDSQIENDFKWQALHFKSLASAYRTSPYFEFYEADIKPLYSKTYTNIFNFNRDCFEFIINMLSLDLSYATTNEYIQDYKKIDDNRALVNAKNKQAIFSKPYHQVFDDKCGFIPNLSILDLLFNLGPESLSYLKQ